MRLAMSLIGIGAMIASAMPVLAQGDDDPLLRPIAPDTAKRWLKPQAPARIYGNSYLVGFEGLNVALIKTSAGLILIDAAVPQSVLALEDNITKLGFKLKDVKFILSTEPHYDHGGGLAALARDTGATVVASPAAAKVLLAGQSGPDDPQVSWLPPFPAVKSVRSIRGGETIKLGDVTIKAVATPGHTAGSMTWTWRSCEGKACLNMVFGSSLNPVGPESYRFSDPAHKAVVAQFTASTRTMRALPCDILFSAHPDNSGGDVKYARFQSGAKPNPYIDPAACRAYADNSVKALAKRMAEEKAPAER